MDVIIQLFRIWRRHLWKLDAQENETQNTNVKIQEDEICGTDWVKYLMI